jgi:carboxyl-terminal processing protease
VSTYAKDTDKPEWEVPYVWEAPTPVAGTPAEQPDDDEPADDITEDFEMRFAKELVSSVSSSSRPKLAVGAQKLVTRVHAEQEKKLVAALAKLGVDWTAPTTNDVGANLEISLSTSADATNHTINAGQVVDVVATVKNTGTGTAYRVLPRVQSDDMAFEDAELPIGKLAPGESKTYTAKITAPKDAFDRVDRLEVEPHEARNAPAHTTPGELRIAAAARPVFSYAYQLVDKSNGDGLVQKGENYDLQLSLKNTGAGSTGTDGYVVMLRNATGDGVTLGKSRFEAGGSDPALAPGQTRELDFPVATDSTLKGDEMVLEVIAYDVALDTSVSEKLHFKVSPAPQGGGAHGNVTARGTAAIHAGAGDDSSLLGTAPRGASYVAIASFGGYTKVKLGATKVGFIASSALSAGGNGNGTYTPMWNTTPPMITLASTALATSSDSFKLTGNATDENHVEDVYVYVSNQTAKIESRKVFYRSNRGGKDTRALEFSADIPLWPGSNTITVVGRSSAEVRTTKTEVIYRDPPRTAQVP